MIDRPWCPKCGASSQILQITQTKDGQEKGELVLYIVNRCVSCGNIFTTIATYELKREVVEYVDGTLSE